MPLTIILGTNKFIDCGSAVTIKGEEVFNLRSGPNDAQLLVDFDVRDSAGKLRAKVAKNQVVATADGYSFVPEARQAKVIDQAGATIAEVRVVGPDTVEVTGTFWVKGQCVIITRDYLKIGPMETRNSSATGAISGIQIG